MHEDGGRLSDTAKDLLGRFARHFGSTPTEQATYLTYAKQRLYSLSQKGVAQLNRALRPIPIGVMDIPNPVQRIGALVRRPAGSALFRTGFSSSFRPL